LSRDECRKIVVVTDWDTEAFPVLAAAYRVTTRDPADPYLRQTDLNAELGRDPGDARTWRTMGELIEDGWLEVTKGEFHFDRPGWPSMIVLTGKARRLLAGWPSDGGEALYARFIASLDELIAKTESPDERTKLERLRADAGDIGKGVLISVLSNLGRVHGVPV
jgi:hypothetical protein